MRGPGLVELVAQHPSWVGILIYLRPEHSTSRDETFIEYFWRDLAFVLCLQNFLPIFSLKFFHLG